MSTLIMILQGGLVGYVAGQAFPGNDIVGVSWEFLAVACANAVLTVAYSMFKD